MNIYLSPDDFAGDMGSGTGSVVTVGNFDGIHKGHQALIGEVVRRARARNRLALVVTFEPHTRSVVSGSAAQPILATFEEKALLMDHLGVDALVRIRFDAAFRQLSAEEFIRDVLGRRLGAREWVLGESHTFGKNRAGNSLSLQELAGKYDITPFTLTLVSGGEGTVSSTGIRSLVQSGDIAGARKRFGHPYLIAATRVEGKKIGTGLGYPTLNFEHPSPDKVVPPAGVFAAKLEFEGRNRTGALYFGDCPTFSNRSIHFEFHLLENGADVPKPGQTAFLWLYQFIRPDKAFSGPDELVEQIRKDVNAIHRFFAEEQ